MSHFGVPIVFPHSGVVRAVSFRLPLLRNSSGTGCTALMAASTSLHQYYWAVFVFHPHQFFFSPLLNIISLQVIVVHISITGKVHNLTIRWYSAWTTENKRFQDCSTFFGGICSSVSDSCHFCLWRLISLWPSLSVFEPMEGIAVLPGNQTTLITYFWFNIKPLKYINTTILVHCLHSY